MKYLEKIVDITTGEETIVEREESAADKKVREQRAKEFAEAQAEVAAKAEARQAILDRLGLTADEAKLLLG
jgi:truncated hemoglobin YjbI